VNSLGFVGVLLKWKVIEIVLSVSIDNDWSIKMEHD
jgi:hypothetical protein